MDSTFDPSDPLNCLECLFALSQKLALNTNLFSFFLAPWKSNSLKRLKQHFVDVFCLGCDEG